MTRQTFLFGLAAAAVLGASGTGLYWLGTQHVGKATTAAAMAAAAQGGASADKKPLYWHDPMVPGQKFDKPGKSPFMDMQLVPVYAEGAGDEGQVTINPRVQQNLGIRTAEVIVGTLTTSLVAVGSVAYNERDVAVVQARSNGFVEKLYVRAPLDPVKKGQPLLELYVPDWIAAQEEYLTVQRMQGKGLEGLVDGARQRMRLAGMSEEQVRLVESSGKVHPRMTIAAPIGGVVAELAVREGMTVMTGAPLFRINGLGTVWVNADVPENVAAQVRPGNAAQARTPGLPGVVFKGKVGAILPEVNAATRTLKARIELANPGGQLVPGMFATLDFAAASRKDVVLVPSEAVIQTGTRSVVMVATGDGKFTSVEVESGVEAHGQTEIRKGLVVGQQVVVSGQFLVDSEASLKGTASRMSEAPGAQPAAGALHHGEGKVEKIGKDGVTLSHGPIASLQWGPMTMDFKRPDDGMPRNVSVGDTVAFDIRQTKDGMYQLTAISPTAAAGMSNAGGVKNPAAPAAMPGGAKP